MLKFKLNNLSKINAKYKSYRTVNFNFNFFIQNCNFYDTKKFYVSLNRKNVIIIRIFINSSKKKNQKN